VARLAITPGMGIGPEVSLKALARCGAQDVVLIGRRAALDAAGVDAGAPLVSVDRLDAPVDGIPVLDPGDGDEPAEVAAIRLAAEGSLDGRLAGMVTGPIHKAQLATRGFAFRGHTDFLGHICGAPPVMAFVGGRLRIALVTTHIPLAHVSAALTESRLRHVIQTAAAALREDLGIAAPRVAVCGLNPHAGEGGLLGTEERDLIGPVCAALRAEGLDVRGPRSAEAVFREALAGTHDLVVAMYHDQGLAPLKLVDFGRSVNWTLGLPILRTSVDHGTADDIVGQDRGDPASMCAALDLARRILEA
jgi:4-hydroxythreonine-4-phosphate dehydrogenase